MASSEQLFDEQPDEDSVAEHVMISNYRKLEERVDKLITDHLELRLRVGALESGGQTGLTDTLGTKIVEFLKQYPGLKFNTGSIAANVGSTSMKMSDKLKVLVGRGVIKGEKKDGLSAMFWWEEKPSE